MDTESEYLLALKFIESFLQSVSTDQNVLWEIHLFEVLHLPSHK